MNVDGTHRWKAKGRVEFLERVFRDGVPPVWCPPITHYDAQGRIDAARIAAHLRHLSPDVGGVLIPGSTGDGWELDKRERRELLEIGLQQAQQFNLQILIGTLHPDANETLGLITEDIEWLKSRFRERDPTAAMTKARVCGFTVCPPRGKEMMQDAIGRALASVLDLGVPTAIYQLPQVTLNEIGAELASELARGYENFIFFKDTSGADAVVLSGKSLGGVFIARGAEGNYARWLKPAGGPYDGFLLASANCFARELQQLVREISGGRFDTAGQLSDRLSAAVVDTMKLVACLADGNPFANSNKAIDHFFAFGPEAEKKPPPRLHVGSSLPVELIGATGKILKREGLMPDKGYLE